MYREKSSADRLGFEGIGYLEPLLVRIAWHSGRAIERRYCSLDFIIFTLVHLYERAVL